ncbi:MAG: hypothetical protein V4526_00745 [Patescibacteria group bacterium]
MPPQPVQFDEDSGQSRYGSYKSKQILGAPVTPGVVAWLARKGIAKDEKTAGHYLVGVALICIVISGWLVYSSFFKGSFSDRPLTREQAEKKIPKSMSTELRNKIISSFEK